MTLDRDLRTLKIRPYLRASEVVKVSLWLATYRHVPPPSSPHLQSIFRKRLERGGRLELQFKTKWIASSNPWVRGVWWGLSKLEVNDTVSINCEEPHPPVPSDGCSTLVSRDTYLLASA